jgi:hypothetical protein
MFVEGTHARGRDRASVSRRTWAYQTKSAFSDVSNIAPGRLMCANDAIFRKFAMGAGFNGWMQHTESCHTRRAATAAEVLQMNQRKRIYYSQTQKSFMWDRWPRGESLQHIADLFDRHHLAIARVRRERKLIEVSTDRFWPTHDYWHGRTARQQPTLNAGIYEERCRYEFVNDTGRKLRRCKNRCEDQTIRSLGGFDVLLHLRRLFRTLRTRAAEGNACGCRPHRPREPGHSNSHVSSIGYTRPHGFSFTGAATQNESLAKHYSGRVLHCRHARNDAGIMVVLHHSRRYRDRSWRNDYLVRVDLAKAPHELILVGLTCR